MGLASQETGPIFSFFGSKGQKVNFSLQLSQIQSDDECKKKNDSMNSNVDSLALNSSWLAK